jgi:hypothetical protein
MKIFPGLMTLFAAILIARPAYAYLDPSTGSMIITAIVGLFASIALAVKTYWYKLKAFFRRDRKQGDPDRTRSSEAVKPGQESGD